MRFGKWRYIIIIIGALAFAGGAFVYFWQYDRILPNTPDTYYKIFNKLEILDGNETTAAEVEAKLDQRLTQYQKTWAHLAGTNDTVKLKALFYII